MKAPVAAKKNKKLVTHGHTRLDPYYWMNQRDNPEVISYLKKENAYLEQEMKSFKKLRKDLFEEIKGRIVQDDSSVPYLSRGDWFYSRYEKSKEYPIHCRRSKSLKAKEEVILDVNVLAKGKAFCQVTSLRLSPDKNVLVYGVDFTGRRNYTLYFKNLGTGKLLSYKIEGTTGSAYFTQDGKSVYYTKQDPQTLRSDKIFRYDFSSKTETLIYEEKDPQFSVSIGLSRSRNYLFIASYAKTSTEYRFKSSANAEGEFQVLQPREKNHEYRVDEYNDQFYIQTNWQAQNFRLMKCSVQKTSKKHWKILIPHNKKILIESFLNFKDFLVLQQRHNGLTEIRILSAQTGQSHLLDFGEEVYSAGLSHNYEVESSVLRYEYTSLTTPTSIIDYDMRSGKKTVKKEQKVLGGFKKSDYKTERIWAKAEDGTRVPISLVHHKKTKLNAHAPLLLYGYGSYGYSLDPYFSSARLSLLNRGFVFAMAHIRGGEELGRAWYEDGKFLKKLNTFHDFIACAKHLIVKKYTHPQKLFAMGGSAGGMLMGGVMNMAPELFAGIVAQVPFVDCVTTMLDDSIPLTTGEYEEWGNPNDKKFYHYMLQYSPYDNVEKKTYPPLLVTSGLHDSQVQYWEPTKWVAKLRDLKTDSHPLYLYTNMKAGHGGASGRFEKYKEVALEYAFLLSL